MKIRKSMPESTVGHVNVTPLIDVVMVLIVFFMLVARIGVATGAEPLPLPASVRGAKLEDMGNTLTLNIRPGSGAPAITALVSGTRETLHTDQTQPTLLNTLKFFRFGPDAREGTADDNPEFKVILRADKDLPYQYLEPILKACAEARVKNVNFTTEILNQ